MLPSYGLYYRPVLRRVTWLLFVLLSVVSMAMGFYDLYKNVPYFKQVMVAMFRPAAAVFEWLEGHTQVGNAGFWPRLSPCGLAFHGLICIRVLVLAGLHCNSSLWQEDCCLHQWRQCDAHMLPTAY